jgi:hypothetical protein
MSDYAEVGYDGPADPMNTECYPFTDWLTLCDACYEADTALKFAATAVSDSIAEDVWP